METSCNVSAAALAAEVGTRSKIRNNPQKGKEQLKRVFKLTYL